MAASPYRLPRLTHTFLSALLLGGVVACGSTRQSVPPEHCPLEAAELGSMRNVFFAAGIWLGGAPAPEDLDLASRRGVERVVALWEGEYDVQPVCDALGLELLEIDLPDEGDLAPGAVDRIVALLGEAPRRKTLIYSRDGATSATLFAIHRVVNEGMPLTRALGEARRAGMPAREGEQRLRKQVARLRGEQGDALPADAGH